MKLLMSRAVKTDLKKLTKDERIEVKKAIREEVRVAPLSDGENYFEMEKHLLPWGDAKPVRQYRVGQNRIYYDFHKAKKCVTILAVLVGKPQPSVKEIL